ncbi:unnamed protein product [Prorocentrum cordatum]|uniref:RNA-directed RNA polymerase n=1 Tax=Prorocentrum cordatum TaxID=2364126 RepID=A0ABN9WC83_9DINO|nr:unnamed protein product [Polarella glacialis]
MSNAFACTPMEWLDEAVEEMADAVDCTPLHHRIHHHVVEVKARGEALHFALGRGGLMGTCEAPKEFAVAVRGPVQRWRAHQCAAQDDLLTFKTPILELPVSCAVVQFADDLKKRHVVLTGLASEAHAIINASQIILNNELEKGGFRQNMKKRELVTELKPTENRKFKTQLANGSGRILPHARHLGGRNAWNDNANVEVDYHIDALKAGWYFRSEAERHRLDVQICRMLRVLEGGAQVAHGMHAKAPTNKELAKRWGALPVRAAPAMQRARWLPDTVRHPLAHQQVIAAVWGGGHLEGAPSPIGMERRLKVSTSPFARQFTRARMLLEGTSGTEDVFEGRGDRRSSVAGAAEVRGGVQKAVLKVDAKLLEVSLMRGDRPWEKLPPRARVTEEAPGEYVCGFLDVQGRRVKPRTEDEGGSKDKRLKGVGDEGLRWFLLVMVKRLLRCSQGMRELGGCPFDTFLCPADGLEATKISEQTHNYSTAAKKALKERGSEVGGTSAKSIMDTWDWLDAHNAEEKTEMTRMCRLDKTCDNDTTRITLVLREKRRRQVATQSRARVGMGRKRGEATASSMECRAAGVRGPAAAAAGQAREPAAGHAGGGVDLPPLCSSGCASPPPQALLRLLCPSAPPP